MECKQQSVTPRAGGKKQSTTTSVFIHERWNNPGGLSVLLRVVVYSETASNTWQANAWSREFWWGLGTNQATTQWLKAGSRRADGPFRDRDSGKDKGKNLKIASWQTSSMWAFVPVLWKGIGFGCESAMFRRYRGTERWSWKHTVVMRHHRIIEAILLVAKTWASDAWHSLALTL